MFIDREDELAWLREGWESGKPQFRILYGRRRVGKSRLLDHFAEGTRKIVYFVSVVVHIPGVARTRGYSCLAASSTRDSKPPRRPKA